MIYEKDIKEEITLLGSLRNLVEIYGEIASVRMKKIRDFVLSNRGFLNVINDIFQAVLTSYAAKVATLIKKGKLEKGSKVTFLAHNGKTVAVLISANTGFYGELIPATLRNFIHDVRTQDVEVTIIGRLGLSLFKEGEPKRPYTYFDFPDYGVDKVKLAEIIRHLVQYDEIHVYYGKYHSVVTQKPTMFGISAGATVRGEARVPAVQYIFEPSMEKILMFFETEIFASLFDQAVRESQLAKFASRILAMDRAGENLRNSLKKVSLEKLRLTHRIVNSKQLNSLSTVIFLK